MGSPCILVVDDDELGSKKVASMLEKRGYKVVTATERAAASRPELAVAAALQKKPGAAPSVPPPAEAAVPVSILSGILEFIGLPSVLTVLEMERKNGVLSLRRGRMGETGRVYVRDGRVVSARVDGKPALRNEKAVFYLLGWREGAFEFHRGEVRVEDEVRTSTMHLLVEGARRLDETPRVTPAAIV